MPSPISTAARSRSWSRTAGSFLVLALLLALAALIANPVLRAVAPQLVGDASAHRSNLTSLNFDIMFQLSQTEPPPVDPWGQPWCRRELNAAEVQDFVAAKRWAFGITNAPRKPRGSTTYYVFYSSGPNGVDEQGKGDDVYPALRTPVVVCALVAYAPWVLGSLALIALIWFALLLVRRRRRGVEAAIVILMAALPTGLATLGIVFMERTPWLRDHIPSSPVALLPAPVVACGTVAIGALVASIALRLVASRQEASLRGATRVQDSPK
jgi:hypothetical protein